MLQTERLPSRKKYESLIIGIPPESEANPYHKQLFDGFERAGVNIRKDKFGNLFRQISSNHEIDVLHINWLHKHLQERRVFVSLYRLFVFLLKLALFKLAGTKLVWTMHNSVCHEPVCPRWVDQIARFSIAHLSDAIIAHCQVAKQQAIKRFRLKEKKSIFVIPHGNYIDVYKNEIAAAEARQALNFPLNAKVLLFLGTIRPYKGVVQLIETFVSGGFNQHSYLCIAGVVYKKEDEKLIRSMIKGHDNIQFFPGYVSDDTVQVYMNACDCVVLPYKRILTSGAAILAMSFGKACLAPRIGCMEEFFEHDGAILYDPALEDSLSLALDRFVKSSDVELRAMGQRNYRKALEWDWDTVAQQFLEVYERCNAAAHNGSKNLGVRYFIRGLFKIRRLFKD